MAINDGMINTKQDWQFCDTLDWYALCCTSDCISGIEFSILGSIPRLGLGIPD